MQISNRFFNSYFSHDDNSEIKSDSIIVFSIKSRAND